MTIDIYSLLWACLTTGMLTLWFGKPGLIGSFIGQVIYYAWLRELLF